MTTVLDGDTQFMRRFEEVVYRLRAYERHAGLAFGVRLEQKVSIRSMNNYLNGTYPIVLSTFIPDDSTLQQAVSISGDYH